LVWNRFPRGKFEIIINLSILLCTYYIQHSILYDIPIEVFNLLKGSTHADFWYGLCWYESVNIL